MADDEDVIKPLNDDLTQRGQAGHEAVQNNSNDFSVRIAVWEALRWCLNEEKISTVLSLQYFLIIVAIGVSLTFARASYSGDSAVELDNCVVGSLQTHLESFITFLLVTSILGFFLVCCCCQRYTVGTFCGTPLKELDCLLLGTVLFGLASAIWFFFRLISESECGEKGHHNGIDVTYSAVELVFIISEMIFLIANSNVKFSPSCPLKVFLMHVVATNFCVWFRITAGEAVDREKHVPKVCNDTVIHHKCVNSSASVPALLLQPANSSDFSQDLQELVDNSMPILYPCLAEFCLSSCGLLFKKWLFPEADTHNHDRKNSCCCCHPADDAARRPLIKVKHANQPVQYSGQLILTFSIGSSLLISFAVVCMVLLISFLDENDAPLTIPILYDVCQLVTVLLALIFAVCGIIGLAAEYSSQSVPPDPPKADPPPVDTGSKEVVVEAALLMISLAGLYLAQGLELTASLDQTYLSNLFVLGESGCWHMLRLERSTGFLSVITGFLQTVFIIGALKSKVKKGHMIQEVAERDPDNRENVEGGNVQGAIRQGRRAWPHLCLKMAAIVLLICNITLWLTRTFELSGLYCHPIYYQFYKPWLQLSDIFYPLWIFFHFHSVASCLDILR